LGPGEELLLHAHKSAADSAAIAIRISTSGNENFMERSINGPSQ
jgi:hypothetical protein